MTKAQVIALAALLLVGATVDPRARPVIGGLYEASSVVGDVRIWRRFGTDWTPVVRGDRLAEGELLQLTAGSSIKVRGVSLDPDERVPRGFMIKTEDPLVTRIEEGSLRSLELSGYFIPLEGVGDEQKKGPEKPSQIRSAWERMVSLFDEQASTDEAQAELAARLGEGAEKSGKDDAKEILIDHPKSGATYVVPVLPTEVAVSWSRLPSGVKGLRVFFWKAEHGSPVPVGQTDESFFRLQVTAGGRYYVRVESPDGRWRSKAHLFIVMTADQISTKKIPKAP